MNHLNPGAGKAVVDRLDSKCKTSTTARNAQCYQEENMSSNLFEKAANSIRENVNHAVKYGESMALNALENVAIDLADIFEGMGQGFDRETFMNKCNLEPDL